MQATIKCNCGAEFTILYGHKKADSFICPNCTNPLPGEMSKHIETIFETYDALVQDVNSNFLFAVEFSQFKIG